MKVYLADAKVIAPYVRHLGNEQIKSLFSDKNILESYYTMNNFIRDVEIKYAKNFLLDSGAFTFMSKKTTATEMNKYVDRYACFCRDNNIQHFFEMDIDCLIGLKKVEEYRNKIESITQKRVIPVFHMSRGVEYFRRMCRDYDYIAFGGIITDGYSRNELEKCMPWFIEEAHKQGCRIHGLGYTSQTGLRKNHFDTVDSTSWLSIKYGKLPFFCDGEIKQIQRQEGKRLVTAPALLHSFSEWGKFAKYAETHL